jgi:DNA-binding MarR family transcriptional regulator
MAQSLPLTAQLSAALIAFTIEADNEAERSLAHHTTDRGGPRGSVWLTSLAMWFNCLRELDDGPLTVAELERRARMSTNLDGMRRWGYITIDGTGRVPRRATRPKPKRDSMLALTQRGHAASQLWAPLPGEIERRWCDRFGASTVQALRTALPLAPLTRQSPAALPDFLPIGSVYGVGIADPPPRDDRDDRDDDETTLPLVSLLARALLTLALDYERGAKLALAVQLNGLRVLDSDGVRVRDLPHRSGVAKEAMAMIVGRLERTGCIVTEPIPGATRGQQVRLTERGERARAAGAARLERGQRPDGTERLALALALAPIVGDGTRAGSPLFEGLDPYPDGWRAQAPAPQRLPWFPMVLHRGGYPDGS